jgi:hypothetical protein
MSEQATQQTVEQAATDENIALPHADQFRTEAARNFRDKVVVFIEKAKNEGIVDFELAVDKVDSKALESVQNELNEMGYKTSTRNVSQGGPKTVQSLRIQFRSNEE